MLLLAVLAAACAKPIFPAFGQNSWNSIRSNLNEQFVYETINAVVKLNLTAFGFEYVNLDDGWAHIASGGRYPNGTVIIDSAAFPNGIAPLAAYAHQHGLKFGIYSDRGSATCLGRTGALGFEAIDANTYASWGVDFLKEDSCFASSNHTVAFQEYATMKKALDNSGRAIYFSLCGWNPWYAPVGRTLGNSWRISGDVNSWEDACVAIDINSQLAKFASVGHYNDPDMLLGSSNNTAVYLTPARSRTQFSLWCIMMAPLMIGADVRNLSPWDLETYTNAELIAVNRDPLFVQGERIVGGNLTGLLPIPYPVTNVWAKPLADGSVAMLFLNNAPIALTVSCDAACFARVGLGGVSVAVRDLWAHQNLNPLANTTSGFSRKVDAWGASETFLFTPM
jgi:alpha-galactosidase